MAPLKSTQLFFKRISLNHRIFLGLLKFEIFIGVAWVSPNTEWYVKYLGHCIKGSSQYEATRGGIPVLPLNNGIKNTKRPSKRI